MAGEVYFNCGEDIGYTAVGPVGVNMATAAPFLRRQQYARCSLEVGGSATTTDGWWSQPWDSAASEFWFSAQVYINTTAATAGHNFLSFRKGAIRRLAIRPVTSNIGSGPLGLYRINAAGTATLLASSQAFIAAGVLWKMDLQVKYAVAGYFRLYYNSTLILEFVGDLTTDGETSLDSHILNVCHTNAGTYWSETMVLGDDTRSLTQGVLYANANGNVFTFPTGNYTQVIDAVTDDSSIVSSDTAEQIAQLAVNSGAASGNPGVKHVSVWARAQRGTSGPQAIQLNVRTGGSNYFSADKALAVSMSPVRHTWSQNPSTAADWVVSDITAGGFNIGVKSRA